MAYLSYSIIGITCLFSIYCFYNDKTFEAFLFSIDDILQHKEIFRLITPMLVHANWMHLFFNMLTMYFFAPNIERIYGSLTILLIYFISGIGGSLFSLLINRNNRFYQSVGASGAVCGVMYASIFLIPGGSIFILPIPFPIPAWAYAIIFLIGSIYGMEKGNDQIGHDAHLGGALTGLVIALIMYPHIVLANYILLIVITLITLGFFGFTFYKKRKR